MAWAAARWKVRQKSRVLCMYLYVHFFSLPFRLYRGWIIICQSSCYKTALKEYMFDLIMKKIKRPVLWKHFSFFKLPPEAFAGSRRCFCFYGGSMGWCSGNGTTLRKLLCAMMGASGRVYPFCRINRNLNSRNSGGTSNREAVK